MTDARQPGEKAGTSGNRTVAAGAHGSILVVDDNPDMRLILTRTLSRLGFTVLTADSGSAALALLETGASPALILTDIVMPGQVDGLALAETVRQRFPATKLLLTSGNESSESARAAEALAAPFLPKPYTKEELSAALRGALGADRAATGPDGCD